MSPERSVWKRGRRKSRSLRTDGAERSALSAAVNLERFVRRR